VRHHQRPRVLPKLLSRSHSIFSYDSFAQQISPFNPYVAILAVLEQCRSALSTSYKCIDTCQTLFAPALLTPAQVPSPSADHNTVSTSRRACISLFATSTQVQSLCIYFDILEVADPETFQNFGGLHALNRHHGPWSILGEHHQPGHCIIYMEAWSTHGTILTMRIYVIRNTSIDLMNKSLVQRAHSSTQPM
jgi:hypothetical protein